MSSWSVRHCEQLLAKVAQGGRARLSHISIDSDDIPGGELDRLLDDYGAEIETMDVQGFGGRFPLDESIKKCPKLRELDVACWGLGNQPVSTAILQNLPATLTTLKLLRCSEVKHDKLTLAILTYPNFSSLKVLKVLEAWSEEDCQLVKVRFDAASRQFPPRLTELELVQAACDVKRISHDIRGKLY